MRLSSRFALVVLALTLGACASYTRMRGVENTWRDPSLPAPVVGQTTQAEVIDRYGPPSQIIGLKDQTVLYYLTERNKGQGTVLIVYNWLKEEVTYDRAVFFFAKDGVLENYGFSRESIDNED